MFGNILEQVKYDTISMLARIRIQSEEELREMEAQRRKEEALKFKHAQASALGQGQAPAGQPEGAAEPVATFVRSTRKVGRNEPCPCGSGKKYKQCHGKLA